VATAERAVARRGARVYIDCLQNLRGKTVARAYSVRATRVAGVSAPATWDEIARGIRPEDVTLRTIGARLRQVGDLWAAFRAAPGIDPRSLARLALHPHPRRRVKSTPTATSSRPGPSTMAMRVARRPA
jgi:bifunctional non-homologous end joining protein LigD